MQLTMVKAVPLDSLGALCATSVENKGESAITKMPQIMRNAINRISEESEKAIGENKQQAQDISNM